MHQFVNGNMLIYYFVQNELQYYSLDKCYVPSGTVC